MSCDLLLSGGETCSPYHPVTLIVGISYSWARPKCGRYPSVITMGGTWVSLVRLGSTCSDLCKGSLPLTCKSLASTFPQLVVSSWNVC